MITISHLISANFNEHLQAEIMNSKSEEGDAGNDFVSYPSQP